MSAAALVAEPAAEGTGLILFPRTGSLPAAWVGPVTATGLEPERCRGAAGGGPAMPLLPQHAEGCFGRPGLSGHRLGHGAAGPEAGGDWSPLFRPARSEHDGRRARVEAADQAAGLRLVTEIEAVRGGAIRARHTLTNLGRQPYIVDSLDVVFPLPGRVGEILDFTGRQTAERVPQRHQIGDGLWLREGRQPAALRVRELDPRRRYQVSDVTPGPRRRGVWEARIPGVQVSGAALAEIGLAIVPQRPLTAAVVLVEALCP